MKIARAVGNLHRHVIPFTLALRVISLTSPTSLALAAQLPVVPSVHAAEFSNQFSQEDFLSLTNEARAEAGLAPLVLNPELQLAALQKAQDMVHNSYWDHYRPSDHKAPWDFIHEAGYQYTVAGENLARGFSTPGGITKAWLESPTHRANVLSPKYAEVGYASIKTTDQDGKTVLLTVQMFGHR